MMMINFEIKKWPLVVLVSLLIPVLLVAQQKQVMIRIVQDEPFLLDQYDTQLTLQKKPFKIQVLLENTHGLYAFAAFSDSICCRLSELEPINGFANLPDRTMKEVDFNKEKELLVNDDSSCAYWFYDKEISWKGFNKKVFELDSNRVVAVKSIKQVYYVPEHKAIKLKDVHKPLYLLFVAVSDFDSSGKPLKELMRRKLRIDWVKEY